MAFTVIRPEWTTPGALESENKKRQATLALRSLYQQEAVRRSNAAQQAAVPTFGGGERTGVTTGREYSDMLQRQSDISGLEGLMGGKGPMAVEGEQHAAPPSGMRAGVVPGGLAQAAQQRMAMPGPGAGGPTGADVELERRAKAAAIEQFPTPYQPPRMQPPLTREQPGVDLQQRTPPPERITEQSPVMFNQGERRMANALEAARKEREMGTATGQLTPRETAEFEVKKAAAGRTVQVPRSPVLDPEKAAQAKFISDMLSDQTMLPEQKRDIWNRLARGMFPKLPEWPEGAESPTAAGDIEYDLKGNPIKR